MWWFRQNSASRRKEAKKQIKVLARSGTLGGFLLFLLILMGCGLQPLYEAVPQQSFPENGQIGQIEEWAEEREDFSIQQQLHSVQIGSISDTAGRFLRNELLFLLSGGEEPVSPTTRLEVRTSTTESALAVEVRSDVPQAILLTYHARFRLIDQKSGVTLFMGHSLVSTTYDFRSQRFSNKRAERDAQQRVALSAARDIYTRLALFFKTGDFYGKKKFCKQKEDGDIRSTGRRRHCCDRRGSLGDCSSAHFASGRT